MGGLHAALCSLVIERSNWTPVASLASARGVACCFVLCVVWFTHQHGNLRKTPQGRPMRSLRMPRAHLCKYEKENNVSPCPLLAPCRLTLALQRNGLGYGSHPREPRDAYHHQR